MTFYGYFIAEKSLSKIIKCIKERDSSFDNYRNGIIIPTKYIKENKEDKMLIILKIIKNFSIFNYYFQIIKIGIMIEIILYI